MKKIILFAILFLVSPISVLATEFAVEVDTGKIVINALEGTINVPSYLQIENIYNGDSAITIWIEAPHYDSNTKTISFSGITPGGFSGKKMVLIFSGHFDSADLAGFNFSNVRALKNDGSATVVPVNLSIRRTEINADKEPPDIFSISIASSPEIFDGAKFITFLTQDNGTGVKGYEYSATWLLPPSEDRWTEASSPLVLSREMLFQKIYVRAGDGAFNYRVASIAGPYHYASLLVGIIILLCTFLGLRRLFSRRSS